MSRSPKPFRVALPLLAAAAACLVSATPSLAAGPTAWPTYHLDNTRAGNDTADGPFTSVAGPTASTPLNGAIYASPLYLNGTVYVATENDYLYALDGSTMAVQAGWPLHLGTAVATGGFPCGNIDPVGITSTPVIDTSSGILYAAGLEVDSSATHGYAHHLWAVQLSTHTVVGNVVIDAPGSDPTIQNQRGALGLANGRVYVAYGGRDGDCGSYHGYVVSVQASDLSGLRVDFKSTPGSGHTGAGIWAPGGMSFDGAGNFYAATGNGFGLGSNFDYSETVVKVSPAGGLQDYWAPTDWQSLDSTDTDIGSITPTVLGGTGYLFQSGKNGQGYLVNTATGSMGHVSNAAFQAALGFGGCFGSSAFDGARIYVPCSGGLVAVTYQAGSPPTFSAAWHVSGCFAESPIVVGGAVWFKDRCGNLKVVDAASGSVRFSFAPGSSTHFSTPSAGGGHVYLALSNSTVLAYTLVATPVAGNGSSTYTLDGLGAVHPAGTAPMLPGAPAFGFDIARALAIDQSGTGGVELDGYGGLHPLGTDTSSAGTYFGWDIARSIALDPTGPNRGWVLDGWGGIHPFGGAHAIVGAYAYWPGWDIARGLIVLANSASTNPSGYVMDAYGGLHPFGAATAITVGPYWGGLDIARGVALMPGATLANPAGWVLDGYGGIHPFGSAPAITGPYDYWPGWDIARGLTVWSAATGAGWTLDGYGALHPFGGAPTLSGSGYQAGYDIFRACSAGAFAGGWDSGSTRPS